MVENKPIEEEKKPSYLEEVKAEREAMEKLVAEMRELKAHDIISGRTNTGQALEKPKEETPQEYSDRILAGKLEVI
jgi:uncharacterized protein YbjQ (UPF0145 family)